MAELKNAIEAVTRVAAESLTLFYRGKILQDGSTLVELGMHDGDELSFTVLRKQ